MKQLFILTAALCCFAACGGPDVGYRITGDITGAGNGKAVLNVYGEVRGEFTSTDTVAMTGGKFTFTGDSPVVRSAGITIIPDGQEPAGNQLFLENAKITVTGNWADMVEQYHYRSLPMTVTGSRNTDLVKRIGNVAEEVAKRPEHSDYARLFKQYEEAQNAGADRDALGTIRDEMDAFSGKFHADVQREQVQLIVGNPDLPAGAYYLDFLANGMTLAELESTFNALSEDVRSSALATPVRNEIEIRKSVQPGQPAPDFTLAQADGTPLTLSDLRGKVVIIDFWASWCQPCRASNPFMKEFYAKYHDKGVEILGITNDTNHDNWRKAIEEDGLPWLNVADEFPVPNTTARVITMYAAPYLPTLILIDQNGAIVAHNIEKADLEAAVGKLLAI